MGVEEWRVVQAVIQVVWGTVKIVMLSDEGPPPGGWRPLT